MHFQSAVGEIREMSGKFGCGLGQLEAWRSGAGPQAVEDRARSAQEQIKSERRAAKRGTRAGLSSRRQAKSGYKQSWSILGAFRGESLGSF